MGCNNNNNNRILEFSLQFCLAFTLPSLRANFNFVSEVLSKVNYLIWGLFVSIVQGMVIGMIMS